MWNIIITNKITHRSINTKFHIQQFNGRLRNAVGPQTNQHLTTDTTTPTHQRTIMTNPNRDPRLLRTMVPHPPKNSNNSHSPPPSRLPLPRPHTNILYPLGNLHHPPTHTTRRRRTRRPLQHLQYFHLRNPNCLTRPRRRLPRVAMDRNSPHPMVDPLLALALATILILTFNFIKGHPLGISGRLSRLLRRGMETE
ncbi:hypothetical protein CSPX01_04440 [Colletotrichum filicis]|nr:hypothetical protein CSPX01_04440 [Colletotrichum filicis]